MKKLILLAFILIQTVLFAQTGTYNFETLGLDFDNPMDIEFIEPNNIKYGAVLERAGDLYICDFIDNQWVKRELPIISVNASTFFERAATTLVIVNENEIIITYSLEEDEYNNETGSDSRLTVNRASKFTIDVLNNTSGTEQVLVEIPSIAGNHQGLSAVVKDDKLFIGIGDGSGGSYKQQAVENGLISQTTANVFSLMRPQTFNNPFGKILRINIDGTIPTNNPFYEGDGDNWNSMIWHIGLRNPFEMCLDINGNLIIADVGSGTRESVHVGSTTEGGYNFGWGLYEGFDWNGFSTIVNPFTGELYIIDQPTTFEVSNILSERIYTHKIPSLDYGHNGNTQTRLPAFNGVEVEPIFDSNGIEGNSLTGGIVIQGNEFGEEFDGAYIFSDFTRGWLNIALPNQGVGRYFESTVNFAITDTHDSPVDITQGLDGSIYVVNLFGGIDKITYEETLSDENIELPNMEILHTYYISMLNIVITKEDYRYASNGIYIEVNTYRNNISTRKKVIKK